MTAMTFESIALSPRRAATRRHLRAAPRVVAKPVAAIAPSLVSKPAARSSTRAGLMLLAAITIGLHALVIGVIKTAEPSPVAPAKPQQIEIQMAPPEVIPPPPPPPPPPKPEPQLRPVQRQAPAPVMPVVSAPTSDVATADTVQVATTAQPDPVPAAPPAPPPPAPVEKITEPRGFAGYLRNPAPEYPTAAQDRGLEGRVILKVFVLASGQPRDIQVAKSSGHRILDDAAIKAVTAWAFDPAKRGSTPIDGWVQVPLTFKL